MARYKTTIDFIHVCRDNKGDERFKLFSKKVGFNPDALGLYRDKIEVIMDFISEIDEDVHEHDRKDRTLMHSALHTHISSDLRALIILAATNQNYQLNIILRHFIEILIATLWADIVSNFKGSFEYLLFTEKWKPYRKELRLTWAPNDKLPNRSIKERLERIRLLNMSNTNGKAYYEKYLRTANDQDLYNLFSLQMCASCADSKKKKTTMKILHYPLTQDLRRRNKEAYGAKYRSDFGYTCCFCNKQKLTSYYALGVPDVSDMVDMLKAISEDRIGHSIDLLWKIYDYLSREFVHFAFFILPDEKTTEYDFGNGKKAVIWGLDSVLFTIDVIKPLMAYYFKKQARARKR